MSKRNWKTPRKTGDDSSATGKRLGKPGVTSSATGYTAVKPGKLSCCTRVTIKDCAGFSSLTVA